MLLGDAVSKLETFVWILSHISRSITWSLFTLKASYLVRWSIAAWSFMWWCQLIDWLKFEIRPSSLLNFGTAYRISCSSPEELLPLGVHSRIFYCIFCFETTDKLTPCQEAYKKAIQNLKVGSYIPRCKDDGGFENMQCGGTSGQCWCVDKDGMEMPGTRTTKNLQCPDPGICCIISQTPSLESIHLL